jgi:hypothetical protein
MTIQQRFEEFHAAYPEVYAKLCELARMVKARGHEQIGIALLYERARWFYTFEIRGTDYKLSNDFRSRYARLIMEQEPDLAGFFTTRELTAA